MKHAYLILAHKNPVQLLELAKAIECKDFYLFIHIDKKVEISSFKEQLPENDFVRYCTDRVEVTWGGFSQICATLKLIDMMLRSGIPFTYTHLLSGQDFPLRPNRAIKDFFLQSNGKSYMDTFPLPCRGWGVNDGLDQYLLKWHIDEKGMEVCKTDHKNNRLKSRSFPEGIQPYGGSQWWSLHIDCIQYLYQNCTEGNVLYDYYQYTMIPDEMFFQTLIMNSPLKDTVVLNNYRFIDWSNGKGHPVTLTKGHYFKVVESDCIFARKFDIDLDYNLIKFIKTYRANRK